MQWLHLGSRDPLMIWTCLNTSLVKVTLNQPGEERWSLRHSLLSFNSCSDSNSWFFWRWVSLIWVEVRCFRYRRHLPFLWCRGRKGQPLSVLDASSDCADCLQRADSYSRACGSSACILSFSSSMIPTFIF